MGLQAGHLPLACSCGRLGFYAAIQNIIGTVYGVPLLPDPLPVVLGYQLRGVRGVQLQQVLHLVQGLV